MTYHLDLSTGKRIHLRSPSAAEAIQSALEKHVGCTVTRCFSGVEIGAQAGITEFEIPPHKALTTKPERKVRRKRVADTSRPAPWIEDFFTGRASSADVDSLPL